MLSGARLGNAFSEYKGKNVEDFQTRIRRHRDGYVVKGDKFYATGALFAHLVPIIAISEDDGRVYAAIAERDAPGLTVIDNWDGFGQRTTASGTVKIENVFVPADYVLPAYIAYDNPSPAGPQSQILHAAIDLGIAEAAIEKTIDLVRNHARPWINAHQDHAWQDQYTIAAIGDLKLRFNAAVEVLAEAADVTDEAIAATDVQSIGRAKIAVAEAKVLTTEIAILATNKLFELGGTRSTLAQHNLDRLWRDARTHTLHDPVRWKYSIIGQYYLTGKEPARCALGFNRRSLKTMTRFTLPDQRSLYYLQIGDSGTPVVLLHGYLDSHASFFRLFEVFGAAHRLYVPDQRGHGESSAAPDYSIAGFTDDAIAFIEGLGVGPSTWADIRWAASLPSALPPRGRTSCAVWRSSAPRATPPAVRLCTRPCPCWKS